MANLVNGFYQINIGTNPNDGTGDSFRDSFIATNINWAVIGNTGFGNTTLNFSNSTISADPGNNLIFQVTNGFVYLGNASANLTSGDGNVKLAGGQTGQFLRANDSFGNLYWSNGASGSEGMVQYNQAGSFGAQSTFVYTEANAGLSIGNVSVTNNLGVGGNVAIVGDTVMRDLSGRNFEFSGDGVLHGNFTVFGNITSANAEVVDIGANLLVIANMATNITLLNQAGITWGNSSVIGTPNTPNIRFYDIGSGNIRQGVLSVYPGIWTQGIYISANNTPVPANIAPGRVTFGPDTELLFQSVVGAAVFSNLQANVFTSFDSNITKLTANGAAITTDISDGSAAAGRLLKLRNHSLNPGNIGLQIINQAGGSNAAWDLFSRDGNGTFSLGWSANPNGTSSNIRLEVSNSGNLQVPYTPVTDSFMGFGPGNATHAGMRYVGSESTLHIEANGAIDSLQLGTDGSTRITILGNSVPGNAGFVGILTETPNSPLTVLGNIDGNRIQSGFTVSRTGNYAGSFTLGVDNANNQFYIANTQQAAQGVSRFVIDSTGNVAINYAQPTVGLDVAGAGRFRTGGIGPNVSAGNNQALTLYGNSFLDTVNLQFSDYGNANVWAMSYRQQTENGDFWIYQNESGANINHITLKYNAALVGINEVNPRANLHVSSGTPGVLANLAVQSLSGAEVDITANSTYGAIGTYNNFPMAIRINNVDVITIGTDANVFMSGGLTADSFTSDTLIANVVTATVDLNAGNIFCSNATTIGGNLIANNIGCNNEFTTTTIIAAGDISGNNVNIVNEINTGSLISAANIDANNLNVTNRILTDTLLVISGTEIQNILVTNSANIVGNLVAGSIETPGIFSLGNIDFYPQGNDGFSVNENFNAGGGDETAYHWTSGTGRGNLVFTTAISSEFTAGFGVTGNSTLNQFVTFSELDATTFQWRKNTGISPVDLTGGTVLFAIDPSGNLTVTGNIAGSLIPTANVTYDLGSNTNRWNDLYLSNSTIYLGTQEITSDSNGVIISGNLAVGNINGTLTTAAQPNITSVGSLTSLTVTGNVSANTFSGAGTGLTGTASGLAVANAANLSTTNFSVRENSGKLYFYYGNTAIASLDNTGHWTTLGNITGFGTP